MTKSSVIFKPYRCVGYVSNHIPLQVRYIKVRQENLIVTCVGKSFHTYGITHFGLLSVGGLHASNITCMTSDTFHVYTACNNIIYAWRRGRELKHTYKNHSKPVHLMIPFGIHLISIDTDSNLIVWDIKEENIFLELTFNNTLFKITALLHPSTYINKILLGSKQGDMQLWNLNTAKLIYTFKGWDSSISCLEQAPAIDVVAIGMESGKIILHNIKYDETVMEFIQDWGCVTSISFRTDGHSIMATGSLSGHIVFWDLNERRIASQLLQAHDDAVTGMVCLPNEPLIVTSSPDNTLKLWIFDLSDGGARLLRLREGHSDSPTLIRFHGSNGHNILSAASDSSLRIFNTQTEQFNKSLGKASYNRKISKRKHRDVEDQLIMPPIIHFTSETTREKEWDNIAAIHSDLSIVTTWSYDKLKMGQLKLLPERFKEKNFNSHIKVTATTLCLTHCGNFVIIGYSTGHVDRFNIQSGIWRDSYGYPKAHDSFVRGIVTDCLNQICVTGGSDCRIKFWKFKNKQLPPLTILNLKEPISFFRYHYECSLIAAALENYIICLFDLDTRKIVRKFEGHLSRITDATFSPDARWLITSSMDCTIKIWDIPSNQLVDHFMVEAACTSLNMSPTGELLATTHVDYLGIFLWINLNLFNKITLKGLPLNDEPTLLTLPEFASENVENEDEIHEEIKDDLDYMSPDQLSNDLITLSLLPSSHWANLLNFDLIKLKNKPKQPPQKPKNAPFFLPTLSTLNNFQFNLTDEQNENSRLLISTNITNLTDFGKLLDNTRNSNNFDIIINKLLSYGPSVIDFEIKSLSPEDGGTIDIMLQFLKCIEFMLNTKKYFELTIACLSVFLKSHANILINNKILSNYLKNIQNCHNNLWKILDEKMLFNLCVIQNLKTM